MSDTTYFSDREKGPRPRTDESVPLPVWRALFHLIQARIDNGSFGVSFPEMCSDGLGPAGTASSAFWETAHAEIPNLAEYPHSEELPDLYSILDLIEFSARSVAQPVQRDYHKFFQHFHLDFDRDSGRAEFVTVVNRLFARNGIAFEITAVGFVRRLGSPGLRDELRAAVFQTGDGYTDRLLEDARKMILSPQPSRRYDALEKLWDAFERVKTLKPGANKKESAQMILNESVPGTVPKFREYLESESMSLTRIGNNLRIRHSETDKEPVYGLTHLDYLFHRMFSFLYFVLGATGRAS